MRRVFGLEAEQPMNEEKWMSLSLYKLLLDCSTFLESFCLLESFCFLQSFSCFFGSSFRPVALSVLEGDGESSGGKFG